VACQAYKSAYWSRPGSNAKEIAETISRAHEFSWQLIQKHGSRLLNNDSYVPDIRGLQDITQETQPHSSPQHPDEVRPGAPHSTGKVGAGVSCCLL
jgi:hypothetical protein